MANVTRYELTLYGDPNGYMGFRAQVSLSDGMTHLGYVRFVDIAVAIPADSMTGGLIYMHESITMLDNVMGLLRNDVTKTFYFASGHAFLVGANF